MTEHVAIFEVGPRDGLQNEARQIPAARKIAFIDRLSQCGFSRIEVSSFVSPGWVPQMADASEVFAGILRRNGVRYTALTPNLKGLERALLAGVDEVAIFAAASETFSRKNLNCTIEESFDRFAPVLDAAKIAGIPVRGYVSCVTDCPFEGPVAPASVAQVAARLYQLGCYEISLGDTIGHGTPKSVAAMLAAVKKMVPVSHLAGHFHDTKGRALENIAVSLEAGLRTFDAAAAGLGGCPFAPGAKGNVATESVAAYLEDAGFHTGIDAGKLAIAADYARALREGRA